MIDLWWQAADSNLVLPLDGDAPADAEGAAAVALARE
jgi:hypothetical protein